MAVDAIYRTFRYYSNPLNYDLWAKPKQTAQNPVTDFPGGFLTCFPHLPKQFILGIILIHIDHSI